MGEVDSGERGEVATRCWRGGQAAGKAVPTNNGVGGREKERQRKPKVGTGCRELIG